MSQHQSYHSSELFNLPSVLRERVTDRHRQTDRQTEKERGGGSVSTPVMPQQ